MAALVQTAASAKASINATRYPGRYLAGVAIAAGQPIYLDVNNVWQLAQASAAVSDVQAFANNSAAAGQGVDAIIEDPAFTHGLTGVTAGDTIWNSPTAGSLTKTSADLVTGTITTVCMIAISATQAVLRLVKSNVAHA